MNSELKAVWGVYKPFKKHLYISFICLGIANTLGFLYPFISGVALNAIVYKEGLNIFIWSCVGLCALNLAQGWVSQFRDQHELKHLDYDLKRLMRLRTSQKMLSLSIGQHHSEHSGIKHRIVSEGENAVVNTFRSVTYEMVPFFYEVVFCAIGCLFVDFKLGIVVVLSVVLTALLSKRYTDKYTDRIIAQEKADDKTTKLAREIVQQVELIKLNGKEDFAVNEQDCMLKNVSQGWKDIWVPFNNVLWNAALFPRVMRVVIMFFAGLRAYQGDMTAGSALILWRLSENSIGRVGMISYFIRTWKASIPRIKRYVEFLGLIPDIQNDPQALKVPRFIGEIEFRNVSFQYPTKPLMVSDNDQEVKTSDVLGFAVNDVSFVLEPGRSYALVGTSGSGKSTIKHLAVRSYDPTVGVIRIDGNPLTQLDLDLFRSRIGVVDQEVPLLDRSLRENLLFLLPDGVKVDDEEIWRACKMACIDRFVHRLEKGLNTLIGERGVKLSGGEKQRVAIARAILKNPDIYIFDEATSSLDALNEDDIVNSIRQVSKGKTTLMIAHRFSTILSADEIIVMDGGKIVGQGTHKQLYVNCPAYKRLVGPQIRIVEELALV
jgi:ATP-binding cassette subfamily B protein